MTDEVVNPLVAFRYTDQFRGWMITGKVSALLSMVGSALIVQDILRHRKQKWMTNRIMIGLSASDLLWSLISPFLGTWLVPAGLAFGSSGNQASCTAQGFLTQLFGFWSGTYNAALAVCYLLVVRWQIRNDDLMRREKATHAVLLGAGLVTAIPPLIYQAYNYNGWWLCHTAAAPLGCDAPGSTVPCERGAEAAILHRWLWNIPHACLFVVVLLAMLALYWTVLQQDRAGDKYNYEGALNRQLSRRVATKGILYVGAFFITWIFYYVIFFMEIAGKVPPMWLFSACAFLVPLQGFFNALVYFHRRVFRAMGKGVSGVTSSVSGVKTSAVSGLGASTAIPSTVEGSSNRGISFVRRSRTSATPNAEREIESGSADEPSPPNDGNRDPDEGEIADREVSGTDEGSGQDGNLSRLRPFRARKTLLMA